MRMHAVSNSNAHAKGVALIFALLLLVVLTVLAVGTFSNVGMQERMASNANLQALAFEAASAGVAESVDFWLDGDNSNWPPEAECFRGLGRDWATDWTAPERLEVESLPDGFVVQYSTRLGCFEAGDWVLLDDGDPDTVPVAPPVQLLALSEGSVFRSTAGSATGDPIATRQIEVRLERRGGEPPDFCALNFCPMADAPSGGDGTGSFASRTLEMANAQAFSIDGGAAGCAVSFPGPDANRAAGQLSENQLRQYQPTPGIVERPVDKPLKGILNDPEALARAVNAAKIGIRASGVWDSPPVQSFIQSYFDSDNPDPAELLDMDPGSNPFENCRGRVEDEDLTTCPTTINGFHYIAGDVEMGPCTFRDFMIVEGDFLINGNPIYTEPLLVLGGTMETRGWGNSENSNIAVVQNLIAPTSTGLITPAYDTTTDPSPLRLGECRFRVAGGGTGAIEITNDCARLQEPWKRLNSCLTDLATMSQLSEELTWTKPGGGGVGLLSEYIQAIIKDAAPEPNNLRFEDIDLVDEDEAVTLFSVPNCAGDPLGPGRRDVIASWREFIDTGRWDAVAPW